MYVMGHRVKKKRHAIDVLGHNSASIGQTDCHAVGSPVHIVPV